MTRQTAEWGKRINAANVVGETYTAFLAGAVVTLLLVIVVNYVPAWVIGAVVFAAVLVLILVLAVRDWYTNGGIIRADGKAHPFSRSEKHENDFPVEKSNEKPVEKPVDFPVENPSDEKPVRKTAEQNPGIENDDLVLARDKDAEDFVRSFVQKKDGNGDTWENEGGAVERLRFDDGTTIFTDNKEK